MLRVDAVAFVASAGLFLLTLELVRRRRLREQYSLLWLLTSLVLIGLSLWRGALELVADVLGIVYAPAALLLVSIGFILLILLNYSLVISRLTDQNNELAQRYALLSERLREMEAHQAGERSESPPADPHPAPASLRASSGGHYN